MLYRSRHGLVTVILLLCAALPGQGWAGDDDEVPLDQIVVTATRTPGLIRDEPLRVEAVPADEIEENLTEQPGNLSALLNELPGVRVQSEAPGLGGAGVQLRGMPTRHTLVLTDGLPLLGTEPDGFGLLQTPPLDLARVEVIKGAASALYGGGALGGVLNLVSQTPAVEVDEFPSQCENLTATKSGLHGKKHRGCQVVPKVRQGRKKLRFALFFPSAG
jgi:outer membrane receptor for ferrienterochelin and colicin